MSQKNIKIFINEIFSKGPKMNYATNKTDVHHVDDIWSLDILDLKIMVPKTTRNWHSESADPAKALDLSLANKQTNRRTNRQTKKFVHKEVPTLDPRVFSTMLLTT